jgi:hypothetical protein
MPPRGLALSHGQRLLRQLQCLRAEADLPVGRPNYALSERSRPDLTLYLRPPVADARQPLRG